MSRAEDIIIEFYRVGAYVKVSAIEPVTLAEVSIVGAPEMGPAALSRAVLRKLAFVQARKSPERPPRRGRSA